MMIVLVFEQSLFVLFYYYFAALQTTPQNPAVGVCKARKKRKCCDWPPSEHGRGVHQRPSGDYLDISYSLYLNYIDAVNPD